jgi:peroxiredoxin
MRRWIFGLVVLPLSLIGCGGPAADPSLDPKSAIVDPSKVKPVTDSMRKDAEAGSQKAAPSFNLTAHTGRTYSEKSLVGKATVIYFLHTDCPCCVDANPFFNQLAEAYPDQVIAIANGNIAKSEVWAKANDAKFPILADESKSTIDAFGAKFGVVTALVDGTGTVVRLIPGYSQGEFEEMAEFLAQGQDSKKLDWSKAPVASTAGCKF